MRLLTRLNLAFGLLLLFLLIVTAWLMSTLLLDILIDSQRKEMREQGRAVMLQYMGTGSSHSSGTNRTVDLVTQIVSPNAHMAFLYSNNNAISLPVSNEEYTEIIQNARELALGEGNVWKGQQNTYLIETIQANDYSDKLVVAAPMDRLKSIQFSFIQRMVLIFGLGALFALLLSIFITRRLVTPLSTLRDELHKVQNRRFSEVQMVKAGGEIGEVAASVHKLAAELDGYHRTQKEFFQNASHELKTPLMNIQGYAEGIRDGVFKEEQAKHGLNVIAEECERLKKIVTEIMLLAKLDIEDGIFAHTEVAIHQVVARTIEKLDPLIIQNRIAVEYREDDTSLDAIIYADPDKLIQALLNVIANAIRHARSSVVIRSFCKDGSIVIEVTDDGEGIPEDIVPKLFYRFVKGHDGENGLGLAIARAIVERCSGSITAENRPEGGALFRLSFPLQNK
ncbi:2-component regulatory system-sensor histidine kinase [Chlamydia abortus]|uniref:histidine kinase n=1 Tax=Paenibacillus residui TaxID=629724 RepID=A0ABW3D661_9BACL|nr:HAMP domain-containing sensor histidine kinase [Paenibacillus sp. 32O-W]SHE10583.1 2-component regulatory system-sensor histidine kinase [Chlamydia abortus]